ncbi:MAG: membrane or secreted protein, partial [Flavobacteriaceae bacterium]
MRKKLLFIVFMITSMVISAQSFIGAWEAYHTSENGEPLRSVVIFTEGYQVLSTYNAESGKFVHSNGGSWELDGNSMTEKVEFHTDDADRVGMESTFDVMITDTVMGIVGDDLKFKRIDDGTPGELQGAWLMSGRQRDGQ